MYLLSVCSNVLVHASICMYMVKYMRHIEQGKATQHHQLRWPTFSFQKKSELPQVGFEPTSPYSLDHCSVH